MDEELEWLRASVPTTRDPDEFVVRLARSRLTEAVAPPTVEPERDLIDFPVTDTAPDEPLSATPSPWISRFAVLGSMAAAVAIVAMVALSTDDETNEEEARDEAGQLADLPAPDDGRSAPPTTVPAQEARPEIEPRELLTVQASQSRALSDGQLIDVSGDGYPVDSTVWLYQCVTGSEPGARSGSCDISTAQPATVDPSGAMSVDFLVRRYIVAEGVEVDCAVTSCDLTVNLSDQPRSVGALTIGLDAAAEPVRAPKMSTGSAGELVDGQALTVTGRGFAPDSQVVLVQCVLGLSEPAPNCLRRSREHPPDWPGWGDLGVLTDGAGSFEAELVVSRLATTETGLVDCAATAGQCVLVAASVDPDGRPRWFAASALLGFDDSVDAPKAGVAVRPDTGFAHGTRVTVTVTGVRGPVIQLCASGFGSRCVELAAAEGRQRGSTFELEVEMPRLFDAADGHRHDCVTDGPCELRIVAVGFPEDPLPLLYDPASAPATTLIATEAPEGALQPGDEVVLDLSEALLWRVRQCVVDAPSDAPLWDSCDLQVGRLQETGAGTYGPAAEVEIVVYRRLRLAGGGIHDCATDGRCQLVIATLGGLARYEPIPLVFDPDARPISEPSVLVDQAFRLDDNQLVSVSVSNIAAAPSLEIQLCPADAARNLSCPLIESFVLDGSDTRIFSVPVPRWTTDPTTGRLHDCADSCLLRVTTGRTNVDASVSSDPSAAVGTEPTLELTGGLDSETGAVISGRGFPTRPAGLKELEAFVCETAPSDRPSSETGCGSLPDSAWLEPPVVDAEGSFTAVIAVPDIVDRPAPAGPLPCGNQSCSLVLATPPDAAGWASASLELG